MPYWSAVAMVAVTGTMAADFLHRFLGISYVVTTPFCGLVLAVVLTWWWRSEATLSIHSVTTRRREFFYWATVMATFAFGTAAGDLTAASLGMGYLRSGLLFGAMILVPLVAWRLGLNAVAAFWTAYILTRPLGASFADWFAKPVSRTGLGYGDGPVTLVLCRHRRAGRLDGGQRASAALRVPRVQGCPSSRTGSEQGRSETLVEHAIGFRLAWNT